MRQVGSEVQMAALAIAEQARGAKQPRRSHHRMACSRDAMCPTLGRSLQRAGHPAKAAANLALEIVRQSAAVLLDEALDGAVVASLA